MDVRDVEDLILQRRILDAFKLCLEKAAAALQADPHPVENLDPFCAILLQLGFELNRQQESIKVCHSMLGQDEAKWPSGAVFAL